MAKFSAEMNRTADATLAVGGILADASAPRRVTIYDIMFGSEASPADNAFLWVVDRGTTALGTSTGVTPSALDPGSAANITDVGENHTVNPTLGVRLLSVPLNQRSTFRWVASPGSEIIMAATATLSTVIRTPTMTAVAVTATVLFDE